MTTTSPKKIIPGLDILKFILAIVIISAHCSLFEEFPNLQSIWGSLIGIAIPIFFSISSYLFFNKIFNGPSTSKTNSIFIHYVKRLAILFTVWYILMIPMTYFKFYSVATPKETLFAIFLSCCFNGYWFIKALIINTTILYFFRKHLISCFIIAILIYLYCAYNYVYGFNPFLKNIQPYYSFYYHIAYFCWGAIFAKYRDTINFSKWNSQILIFCWLMMLVTTSFFNTEPLYRFFSFPLLFPVFFNLSITPKPYHKTMRDLSIILYMVQFLLIWLYNGACDLYLETGSILFQIVHFSIVRFAIVLSIALCVALLIIRKESKYQWLKFLH